MTDDTNKAPGNKATQHLKTLMVAFTWKTFQRWIKLRDTLNLQSDDAVAVFLLDKFDGSHETTTQEEDTATEKTKQLQESKRFSLPQDVNAPINDTNSDEQPNKRLESMAVDGAPSLDQNPNMRLESKAVDGAPSLDQNPNMRLESRAVDGAPSPDQNSSRSISSLVQTSDGSAPSLVPISGENKDSSSVTEHATAQRSVSHQCSWCSLQFHDKETLSRHAREKHDIMYIDSLNSKMTKLKNSSKTVISIPQKVLNYSCGTCKKRSLTIEGIEKHKLEAHGKVDKFQCRLCIITYTHKRALTKHMVRDHPGSSQKPYKCSLCELDFSDKDELAKHGKVDHEPKFKCKFCLRAFNTRYKYRKHEEELHLVNEDGTVTNIGYECQACKQYYKNIVALTTHTKSYCKEKGHAFSCNKCKDVYESAELLKNHYKEVHNEALPVDFGIIDKCSCGKTFTTDVARQQHRCKAQRHQCPHCEKSYRVQASLDQHIAVVHSTDKPEFPCETCGKVYNRIQNLRYHISTEHEKKEKKKFKCTLCAKEYTSKQALGEHVRKHTGEKVLCPQCGEDFSTLKTLRRHEKMIHANKRTHACHLCNKAYFDSYNLKHHIDSHYGKRTLKCRFCDKKFVYSSGRALHQRTQHPEEHAAYMRNVKEQNHIEIVGAESSEAKGEAEELENVSVLMDDADNVADGDDEDPEMDMVEVMFGVDEK